MTDGVDTGMWIAIVFHPDEMARMGIWSGLWESP
ncbi:MAG: hypothetical protein MW690_000279 [Methanophagales archaeon]|nr:hypothetical protein [Methanophagales archaeon]